MESTRKLKIKPGEVLLLLLPVLVLFVFALSSQTGDLRKEIGGKWRNSANGIVEFRVQGNTLLAWVNGRRDDRFIYRLVDDSYMEITDLYASKKAGRTVKNPAASGRGINDNGQKCSAASNRFTLLSV